MCYGGNDAKYCWRDGGVSYGSYSQPPSLCADQEGQRWLMATTTLHGAYSYRHNYGEEEEDDGNGNKDDDNEDDDDDNEDDDDDENRINE